MFTIRSFLHWQSWWPLLKGGPRVLFCLWSFTQELPALIWGHKVALLFFFWVAWADWETWLSSCLHWGWADTSFEWCSASKPEPCAGLRAAASCCCLCAHIVEPSWCMKPVVLMEGLFSQNCFVFSCFWLLFTCLIHHNQNPDGNPCCLSPVRSPGATSSYVHGRAQLSPADVGNLVPDKTL